MTASVSPADQVSEQRVGGYKVNVALNVGAVGSYSNAYIEDILAAKTPSVYLVRSDRIVITGLGTRPCSDVAQDDGFEPSA